MGEQEGIKLGELKKGCWESGMLKIGRTQMENGWIGGKELSPGCWGCRDNYNRKRIVNGT